MPQEIYNEGRVVGLSAWELFLKAALANGVPPEAVPNEAQWLTSMIGSGASMILKISANTLPGVHDYVLPSGSNLTAAGVIIANPFQGTCEWDSSTWATKVTSYSSLIQNDSNDSPSADGSSVPFDENYSEAEYANCVSEFVKITDGIVFTKNATWIPTGDAPEKDIDPNFNESSTIVRLYIASKINYDIAVLLTGFANKRILQGLSGYAGEDSGISVGGSTDTVNNDWVNGGMLGPEIIPWSSKIVFTVPSSAYNLANSLTRRIPSDTTYTAKTVDGITFKNINSTVRTNSLIDFNSINLTDYYDKHSSEFSVLPTLQENVSKVSLGISDSYNTVVAWYPGMTAANIKAATNSSSIFPPAIYATQVTTTGTQKLVPLDVAAPGTVKGFKNSTQATNYVNLMRDNFAMYYDTTNNTYTFVSYGKTPSGTAKIEYTSEPKAKISAGNNSVNVIALNNSSGTAYNTGGTSGDTLTSTEGKITWTEMLNALKNNKKIDVYSARTRNFTAELVANNKIGVASSNPITDIKTSNSVETKSGKAQTVTLVQANDTSKTTQISTVTANSATMTNFSTSIKVSTQFIEFADGKRLYISGTEPAGTIPNGSIGIGW